MPPVMTDKMKRKIAQDKAKWQQRASQMAASSKTATTDSTADPSDKSTQESSKPTPEEEEEEAKDAKKDAEDEITGSEGSEQESETLNIPPAEELKNSPKTFQELVCQTRTMTFLSDISHCC